MRGGSDWSRKIDERGNLQHDGIIAANGVVSPRRSWVELHLCASGSLSSSGDRGGEGGGLAQVRDRLFNGGKGGRLSSLSETMVG